MQNEADKGRCKPKRLRSQPFRAVVGICRNLACSCCLHKKETVLSEAQIWQLPKIKGTLSGGPYHEDPTI